MKIISKHTDYYDWCVGHFGYDPHIVYDRREFPLSKPFPHVPDTTEESFLIYICGEVIPVVRNKKGKWLFDWEKDLPWYQYDIFSRWKGKKTTLNVEHRQPVLIDTMWVSKDKLNLGIPMLSEYGFPQHIDAMEMYQRIYDFLSWLKDNPAPPDTFTDKDRIKAHGFDTKRSFRPNMKK